MMFFSFLWVCLLLEIRVFFVLLIMSFFCLFVLTVETSLIDKDGKVSMSLKGNILGTLVLRRDMMFFSSLWVRLFLEIRVFFVLLMTNCGFF